MTEVDRAEPTLSVIVVTYRSEPMLPDLVSDLAAVHAVIPLELIIVVNDGSTETYVGLVADVPFDAVVVDAGANVGFGRAVNRGAALARATALLVANPDCRVSGVTGLSLALDLVYRQEAVICGFTLYRDRPGDTPAGAGGISRRMLLAHAGRVPRAFTTALHRRGAVVRRIAGLKQYGTAAPDVGDAMIVDAVPGAMLVIGADAFAALGGYRETIFLNAEDADLYIRAQLRYGLRSVQLVGTHEIRHDVGASKAGRARDDLLLIQGELVFALDHYGPWFTRGLVTLLLTRRRTASERRFLLDVLKRPRLVEVGRGRFETLVPEAS